MLYSKAFCATRTYLQFGVTVKTLYHPQLLKELLHNFLELLGGFYSDGSKIGFDF